MVVQPIGYCNLIAAPVAALLPGMARNITTQVRQAKRMLQVVTITVGMGRSAANGDGRSDAWDGICRANVVWVAAVQADG